VVHVSRVAFRRDDNRALVRQAPMITCNSATNPLKPGSPIDATLAMTNVTAAKGSARLNCIPSSTPSSRVCVRS